MKRFFGFFLKPKVAIAQGVVCLVLVIWFAGPYLAFAGWHPLESAVARVVAIVVLLALWLGRRIGLALRSKIANLRMLEALSATSPSSGRAESANDGQRAEIEQRFRRAMAAMKASSTAGKRGMARWLGGTRHAYQLPWYVFIGPPGSGKTTALLNAGLQFPLAAELGNDPVRGVGGTRLCDWWFTDQAVLIDTAGRFTTQDSDAQVDASEWKTFLTALRKHRPRQPINGVIVTLSVADLLTLPPAERQAQATAVQTRLQELLSQLENDFPVYLLITKADLLAGFLEFFGDLDKEAREQVWGSTFDYPEPQGGAQAAFGLRFDELVARIDALALDRLQAERDPRRRAAIFGLARQLAALRAPLAEYCERAFPQTRLARQSLFRGFYFASGTQEGSPIDRVMGSLARQFGLQRQLLPAMRPSGRAFFLHRLLHGVIFPEAGLAGTNLRWERRRGVLRWVAGVGVTLLLVAGAIGWTVSYLRNDSYIEQVAGKAEALRKDLAGQVAGNIELRRLLRLYDEVANLAHTEAVDPADPRLSQSLGLFQGPKLEAAASQAYHRLIAQTLAPLLAARLSAAIKAGGANPVLQYENLKAYVMMREPGRLDAAALRGWFAFDLANQRNLGLSGDEQRALLRHVDALLSRNVFQDHVVVDTDLITQVRASLVATPLPQRVYERLRRQGVGDLPDFRIGAIGGPATPSVFARISGRPLSEGVPAFFTHQGYHKGMLPQLEPTIRALAEEEVWVLGVRDSENARRVADAKGRESLVQEVKRLYLNDYALSWERFIADITLKRGANLGETIAIARLLAAADSPVMPVMRAVVREVTLSETQTGDAPPKGRDKTAEAVQGTKERLEKLLGGSTGTPTADAGGQKIEAQLVDARFESLRAQVRAPEGGGQAPLEKSLAMMNDLYQALLATEQARREGRPPPGSDAPLRVKAEAGRLPEPMRGMMTALVDGSAAQSSGATRETLSRQVATLGGDCAKLIGGRYPLTRDSRSDITPDDFARVFAPGSGLIDDFFQKNLAPVVDSQVKPWRFRDPSMGDSAALRQFQQAAEIRDVFFGGGKALQLRLEFRAAELDPGVGQMLLNVDGQELRHQGGQPVPRTMQWPGPGGTNQIRLQITAKDGGRESQLLFEGPWALFRMFDRAQIEPGAQPEKFRANFIIDGRKLSLEVTSSSVRNPFRMPELQGFQCPRGL